MPPSSADTTHPLWALFLAIGLLAAVYVPTFIVVSLIHPPIVVAIPLVIVSSLVVGLVLIHALSRRSGGLAAYGFRATTPRFAGLALLIGVPFSVLATVASHAFPVQSPIDTSAFPLWMLALYFGIGAPIQEEVIFRGLLQSFVQERWAHVFDVAGVTASVSVIFAALLFGIVHLGSGTAVLLSAIVLGLIAGELRRRSGSLIPAVIVHALFNVPGMLWP